MRADEVIQNVTVYPDATCTATVTVRTPTQAPTAPSVILRRLNGEQAAAAAANMCGPRPHLRGLRRSPLPAQLVTEIGPSGVLVGKLSNGDRLMIPVTDAGEPSRVFVAGDDPIAKRIVIRAVGAGERVCVHTRDKARWASVRMPEMSIVSMSRPAPRTTVSIVEYVARRKKGGDGAAEGGGSDIADIAISPTPRPATVITIAPAGTKLPEGHRHGFEVTIEQVGPATLNVTRRGRTGWSRWTCSAPRTATSASSRSPCRSPRKSQQRKFEAQCDEQPSVEDVDTMGDLHTARRHFDRAMAIKSRQGRAAALARVRRRHRC